MMNMNTKRSLHFRPKRYEVPATGIYVYLIDTQVYS